MKTDESIRTVVIPKFLVEEIRGYVNTFYSIPADERIFPIVPEAVQHVIKGHADKAGVKKIRVHDVRHSHCAYLIHRGVQPMIIKERLGLKDIKITLNTYGHLYHRNRRKWRRCLTDSGVIQKMRQMANQIQMVIMYI